MKVTALTTVDNPHDPIDDFDAWYAWDMRAGYNTSGFLARIANLADHLTEVEQNEQLELAIDEIVRENVSGLYRKVTKEVDDETKTPSETMNT